jgi:hypothetical protein
MEFQSQVGPEEVGPEEVGPEEVGRVTVGRVMVPFLTFHVPCRTHAGEAQVHYQVYYITSRDVMMGAIDLIKRKAAFMYEAILQALMVRPCVRVFVPDPLRWTLRKRPATTGL